MIAETNISCAVRQVWGLNRTPKTLIKEIANKRGDPNDYEDFITVVFSDDVTSYLGGGGNNLARTIRKHKLGTIQTTKARKNPNSENKIKTWLWSINWTALNRYLQ